MIKPSWLQIDNDLSRPWSVMSTGCTLVRKRAIPQSLQLDAPVLEGKRSRSNAYTDGNASPTACLTPTDSATRLLFPVVNNVSNSSAPAQPTIRRKINDDYMLLSSLDANGRGYVRHLATGNVKLAQQLSARQKLHYIAVCTRLSLHSKLWSGSIDGALLMDRIVPSSAVLCDGYAGEPWLIRDVETGSLHTHVQQHKHRHVQTVGYLFAQIVSLVAFCHSLGIVMRDLKLRKFIFVDADQSQLGLGTIDDLVVCPLDSDSLLDRHGCPAYVSPEILDLTKSAYSGKASDMWSCGVLLFVMLTGRYPFYDTTAGGLFDKIRQCRYSLPESCELPILQRVLLSSLLRAAPTERPSASHLLATAWLQSGLRANHMLMPTSRWCSPLPSASRIESDVGMEDQVVPS